MKWGFTTRGFDALSLRLEAMSVVGHTLAERAFVDEGKAIVNDARNNYVPVETTDLKQTGRFTDPPTHNGNRWETTLSFGGTGTRVDQYAIAVHEHLSQFSPPSWQGKSSIRWSKPGTGPKYLEIPFNNAVRGMLSRLASRYRQFYMRHTK